MTKKELTRKYAKAYFITQKSAGKVLNLMQLATIKGRPGIRVLKETL